MFRACTILGPDMLHSETIELKIYLRIKPLGPGSVTMTLPMLHQATGEDFAVLVERLKGLEAEGHIALFKYSGETRWARGDFPDGSFFYTNTFIVEITPTGRKYFERLEQIAAEARSSTDRDDRQFQLLAIEEARKSIPEDDRPHPRVGAVVAKDGRVLSQAHRGETLKSHAEYIALERKLPDDLVAGATVYTTLEPCTTRTHPKVPCAQRIIDRRISRVVIGMLDPNPEIRGIGYQALRDAGIDVQLFPGDLARQVEEINREFTRAQKEKLTVRTGTQTDSATMAAARALTDATWDLQRAAWSFQALHAQYGVAREVKAIAQDERQIITKVEVAIRVFGQDYDFPKDLAATVKEELGKINIALVNLRSFAITGQDEKLTISANQVQDSCERIRAAAKPYAYRK